MRKRTWAAGGVFAVLAATLVSAWPHGSPATQPSATIGASRPLTASTAPVLPTTLPKPSGSEITFVTRDPDAYASAVAAVVFGMDTRTHAGDDYQAMLLREADPALSDTGRQDLTRTIQARIPSDEIWARMRTNQQWSTWQTAGTSEPGSWTQVVADGQAEPGWAMRNVTGWQTTRYLDNGTLRVANRERALTVGMRCPAPGATLDRCHLLLVGTSVLP